MGKRGIPRRLIELLIILLLLSALLNTYLLVRTVERMVEERQVITGAQTGVVSMTVYVCGDDTVQGTEQCDGSDLNGATCISQGFASGNISCLGNCSGFNTSQCVQAAEGGGPAEGEGGGGEKGQKGAPPSIPPVLEKPSPPKPAVKPTPAVPKKAEHFDVETTVIPKKEAIVEMPKIAIPLGLLWGILLSIILFAAIIVYEHRHLAKQMKEIKGKLTEQELLYLAALKDRISEKDLIREFFRRGLKKEKSRSYLTQRIKTKRRDIKWP